MWGESVGFFGFNIHVYQLLIFTVVISFILGWLAARFRYFFRIKKPFNKGVTKERITSNTAFMKGLSYILSDQPEEAIEELTRAVAADTQTVEAYVALGNLFRSKGEIDRAIRIRQSIMLRPNLDADTRTQAMYDLGMDYRTAGFFERAIKTFNKVLALDPNHIGAYRQLIQIYEETSDWGKAFNALERLTALTGEKPGNILAHYQTEIGKIHFDQGRPAQARQAFQQALLLDPACVDAYLHLGDLYLQERKPKKVLDLWRKIADVAPEMTFLSYGRLARVYSELKDLKPVEEFLIKTAENKRDPLPRLALARLHLERQDTQGALAELRKVIELDPTLLEVHREVGRMLLSQDRDEEALAAYRELLANLKVPGADFQCGQCGYTSEKLRWKCPQCQGWDTMILKHRRPAVMALGESFFQVQPESGQDTNKV